MKKYTQLTIVLLFMKLVCFAQLFSGTIIDAITNEKVSFVNMGIIGKSVGTVSNDKGYYEIVLNDKYDDDSIRIFMIGYQPKTFKVSQFKTLFKTSNSSILLKQSGVNLSEVVVRPKKGKTKIAGHKFNNKSVILGLATENLGCEVAGLIWIKKQVTFINQININLANNPFDSVVFRINLYNSKNNQPDKNILKQPIYVTTKIKSGTVSIDVSQYNLMVEDIFFVGVQWISNSKKETLNFCSGIGGKAFIRTASEDDWLLNDSFGVGIHCNISY
jgi:hypothetical protein